VSENRRLSVQVPFTSFAYLDPSALKALMFNSSDRPENIPTALKLTTALWPSLQKIVTEAYGSEYFSPAMRFLINVVG
ncbi:hypothetical protein OGATHE_004905, partial [Ogataea polymorpha]